METKPLLGYKKPQNSFYKLFFAVLLVIGILVFALKPMSCSQHFNDTFNEMDVPLRVNKTIEIQAPQSKFNATTIGPVPVHFEITTQEQPLLEYFIYSEIEEPEVTVSIESTKKELKITVVSPPEEPHSHNHRTRVKVVLSLPLHSLDTLFDINVGSIVWTNPSIHTSFISKLNVGSIKTATLTTPFVDIKTKTGPIDVESVLSKDVNMVTSTGTITGEFKEYETVRVETSVGSVQVALNPLPFATTTLSTQTGSVFATLTKYEGMFMASTGIGSVKVTGNDVVIDKRTGRLGQDVEGHVGNGNCLLNAKTKVGSVHLDFE